MRIRLHNIFQTVCCAIAISILYACHSGQPLVYKKNVQPDVRPQESIYTTPVLTRQVEVPSDAKSPKKDLTWQDYKREQLEALLQDSLLIRSQLGLSVFDLTAGQYIIQYNADQRMRPASCEKLVTSISALHYLGGDYLLKTKLCITGELKGNGDLVGDVYVVGGMDPMLSKDDVKEMAKALQAMGVKSISGKMYMDLSMKDANPLGWGWCWDDDYGPLTALSVENKDTFTEEWLDALKV